MEPGIHAIFNGVKPSNHPALVLVGDGLRLGQLVHIQRGLSKQGAMGKHKAESSAPLCHSLPGGPSLSISMDPFRQDEEAVALPGHAHQEGLGEQRER